MNKYGVIYKITNVKNSKVYIGLTVSKRGFKGRYSAKGEGIERVFNFYSYQAKNNQFVNVHLLNSIKNYGFESFEIVEEFDVGYSKQDLIEKEQFWINHYQSNNYKYGYNRTEGGETFLKGEEHPRYNSIKYNCEVCGKECSQNLSKYNRSESHYCSQECKSKGSISKFVGENNPNYNRVEVKCDFCDSTLKRSASLIRNRNYCSKTCQNEHQRTIIKGSNNPNYGNGDKVKGDKNGRARKVICLNTNEIFDCLLDGANRYGVNRTSLSTCCSGRQKTAGKLPDGTPLRWKYYDEYLEEA